MRIAYRNPGNFLIAMALLAFAPAVMAVQQVTYNWYEEAACPSENIFMEGSVRFQIHEVQAKGHTTSYFYAFWTGNGWGLDSGDEYLIRGKWMEVIQNPYENLPYLFVWNDHFQLIGKGTAPDFDFANKVKILINANGEPIIEFEAVDSPCPTVDFGFVE